MRSLCAHCEAKARKGTRPLCNCCYRAGYAKLRIRVRVRPPMLEDTGMRVDNARHLLILPDGTQHPVPDDLVLRFWFESDSPNPNEKNPARLRVLRPANFGACHD